jgi:formamidopyrimidine-DNA glycosylase
LPELPEIETIKNGLSKVILGEKILSAKIIRRDLRFPVPKALDKLVCNSNILSVKRRSKYLILELDKNISLIIHLGMSGKLIVSLPKNSNSFELKKHDHLVFLFENQSKLIFNDARRFGFVDVTKNSSDDYFRFRHIGPEPLEIEFTKKYLFKKMQGSERNIKSILMDQKVVAGLGNIYVIESLWWSMIHPNRLGKSIKELECIKLIKSIRQVLNEAISFGGTSLKDFRKVGGEFGYFQNKLKAYGKEKEVCPRGKCAGIIKKIVISGRSTFYCPICQR